MKSMIRDGRIDDLHQVKALSRAGMFESQTYRHATPEFSLYEAELLTSPSYGMWVSEEDDIIDGFLIGQLQRGLFFHERIAVNITFYVKPKKRGTMIPFFLIQRFEWWARENGARQLHMMTTGGINIERNTRFFTGLGYKLGGIFTYKDIGHGFKSGHSSTDGRGDGAAEPADAAHADAAEADAGDREAAGP